MSQEKNMLRIGIIFGNVLKNGPELKDCSGWLPGNKNCGIDLYETFIF